MTPKERAHALVADMPWITNMLSIKGIEDLRRQVEACLTAAIEEEREACAKIVDDMEIPCDPVDDQAISEDFLHSAEALALRIRERGKTCSTTAAS